MEIILNKLNDLENRLKELRSINYQKGRDEYYSITQLLERIIDRTYPEKDAKEIKRNLYQVYVAGGGQEKYVVDINLAIRTISTIRSEYELFGFDNFKPLKEKVESEWQIGSENIGVFFKKKKSN